MASPSDNEQEDSGQPTLRVVSGDLFLGGRIAGYGRAAGYQITPGPRLRDGDWARQSLPGQRMIIDLSSGAAWAEGVAQLSEDAKQRVAAYAPHVRLDLLKSARAAGIGAVFTQGQLDAEIPRWLGENAS